MFKERKRFDLRMPLVFLTFRFQEWKGQVELGRTCRICTGAFRGQVRFHWYCCRNMLFSLCEEDLNVQCESPKKNETAPKTYQLAPEKWLENYFLFWDGKDVRDKVLDLRKCSDEILPSLTWVKQNIPTSIGFPVFQSTGPVFWSSWCNVSLMGI